jgi:uncharacterized protein (TIGR04255 family)
MAVGVQFRALFDLRGILLGPLRDLWRDVYPNVQEQPPLAPAVELDAPHGFGVQLAFGPGAVLRYWFISADNSELVQLQNDRLTVNWRQVDPSAAYLRFPHMRDLFEQRMRDLAAFVEDHEMGDIAVQQVEVNHINAVDAASGQQGQLQRMLRGWSGTPHHHLGEPEQARIAMTFRVPDVGTPPTRMHVSIDPAQRPTGSSALFMTLTARGAPAAPSLGGALEFVDGAHAHLVQCFLELTPQQMHAQWGLENVSSS